jgi:hypothetical protein
MAYVDTYYRLNAKNALPEEMLDRIQLIRNLSRAARTHAEKKQLANLLGRLSKASKPKTKNKKKGVRK